MFKDIYQFMRSIVIGWTSLLLLLFFALYLFAR